VLGIGVDTLSIDPGRDARYEGHRVLSTANKWALECLANLGRLPARGARIFVGAPKVELFGSGNNLILSQSIPDVENNGLIKVNLPANQGVFRMNKNSAGALGASDVVKAEKIKFDWDRPQDAPHVFGQDYVDEPADNGFPTFSIEVNYPRMNTVASNSLFAGLRDATTFKADLTFLGVFINSTDQYKKLYQWPFIQLEEFEAATVGANQVKPKATFKARMAPTSPTGMAFVRPFRLTRIMTQSVVAF